MPPKKVVLIAHDNLKSSMVEWAKGQIEKLKTFQLFATGTTGTRIEKELGLPILKFKSGPLGGDQQIGAKISEGEVDLVVFFWNPMAPHPHDVDVKALLRIAVVYNIPLACNWSSADLILNSIQS
jgi:methylglyoxal synthase